MNVVLFEAADKIVDIDLIFKQDSAKNVTFRRLDISVQFFILASNEETGILRQFTIVLVQIEISMFAYIMS